MTNACKIDEAKDNLAFLRNTNKPSLENLSYALRHPETWPEGFVWNYGDCGSCAMGLARKLWNTPRTNMDTGATIMARTFAMPYTDAQSIFMGKGEWVPRISHKETEGHLWWKKEFEVSESDYRAVTPEMVADQIDAYIAKNK